MPPARKIRRVTAGPRLEGEGLAASDDGVEEEVDAPEISGLVPPEVVSRIQSSERRVDDLGRRFKQISDQSARALGKADQLSDELETLKNETLENMQVAFDENAEILEAIEKDVTDLKSRLGDIDSQAVDQLKQVRESLETRLADMEKARTTLYGEIEQIKSATESIRGDLKTARGSFDEHLPRIDARVKEGLDEAEKRMEIVRHELEVIVEEARRKSEDASIEMQIQFDEAVSALEKLGLGGGSLSAALTSLVEKQRSQADEFTKKVSALQSDAGEDVKKQLKSLEDKLDGEITRAKDSVKKIEATLERAGGVVERSEKVSRQIEEIETKLNPLVEKFEQNSRMVADSRERLDVALRLVDDVEAKIRRLVAPVDDAMDLVESFESVATESGIGFELPDLLQVMIKHNASDLHVKVGTPPTVRLDGDLISVGEEDLTENDCKRLIFGALSRAQRRRLLDRHELDFAYSIPEARFRVNVFLTRGTVSAAFRMLRTEIPTVEELNLPPVLKEIASEHSGLILVTGPAGMGKSTTLASLIEHINATDKKHVVTIEDPIEFVHSDKKSIITQREIGTDTTSFAEALRMALRQDPNVILIGEMRDAETIMTAAIAAETGHLVFSTLHTQNTIQAIDRMLDVFQGEQQRQFRLLLASTLRAVISQRLLQRADQQGRVVAVEVLRVTQTISSLILEGKTNEIYPYLQHGGTEGMQTFTASLARLYEQGLITKEEALYHADQPTEFRLEAEGHTTGTTQYAEGDTLMNWL